MTKTGRCLQGRTLLVSLGLLSSIGYTSDSHAAQSRWQPGMTAVFSGFLCHSPVDAVHGLIAALDVPDSPPVEMFKAIETPLHCFYSDGPLKFVGRIPQSKVFVDPDKGRFVFVRFDLGGNVTAYSWIAEDYVSDEPYVLDPHVGV